MFRNLKIRTKLTLIFVLLITASIIIISYIGFHIAEESLKSTYIAELKSIADLKVDKIETFFLERKGDIKTAQDYYNIKTNLPIVTQFANDRTNPAYIEAKRMLDGQLKTFQNVYGYRDVMLVNPGGEIVYVSNEAHAEADLDHPLPGPDGKAFEEGKEGIYFSDVFHVIRNKMEGNDFEMLITAPAHDFKGKFIGVIALEVNMVPIYEFIQDTTGLGETGETLIGLNKDNYALFLNPLRHDTEAALKRKAIFGRTDAFPIQEAVQGRNGSGLSIDYRGEKIIAAWQHIPSLNWGLVAKIDTSEAFAPVKHLRNITIIIVIASIIAIVTITIIITTRITKPIRKLVEGTKRLAKGDLAFRIETQTKDEIGQLATSFNDMTFQLGESNQQLQDYALNLEEKVEDKTKEIKRSKEYIENLIETAQDAIVYDENQVIIGWNKSAERVFGYSKREIIGQPITTLIPEKYRKEHDKGVERYLKTGEAKIIGKTTELSGITKEGIEIPLEISLTHQKLGNERHIFTAIIRDITERKEAIKALQQSEGKYRALVHAIPDIIYKIDVDGHFTFLNNSIRTLGYEPKELIGKHFSKILHPDDVKSFSRSVVLPKYSGKVTGDKDTPKLFDERRGQKRMTRNLEVRLLPKNQDKEKSDVKGRIGLITSFGEINAIELYYDKVERKNKRLRVTVGIITDITEKIKLQAEMMRAGQLALIGEIAAGIAHEINNPIYGIINYAQLIADESDKDSRAHKFGKLIMEEGNRIAGLTKKFLSLSRSTTGKKRPVQIYELISNSLKLTKVQLKKDNIIIKDNISKDIPTIIANPQEIHQVFLNLIQNARYALNEKYPDKDKGKILEISCNKVLIDDYEYVRIIFYDRGIGIPENILNEIISPFFTTKPSTNGTGIGLSISQNIISNHDGKMTIESMPGQFTKVVIDLPATELTIIK